MTNAVLAGHDLGPFELVDGITPGYQAKCRQCGKTVWCGDSGLMCSLLGDGCEGESKRPIYMSLFDKRGRIGHHSAVNYGTMLRRSGIYGRCYSNKTNLTNSSLALFTNKASGSSPKIVSKLLIITT